MEMISAKSLLGGLNTQQITCQSRKLRLLAGVLSPQGKFLAVGMKIDAQQTVRSYTYRGSHKVFTMSCTVSPGVQNLNMSATKFKDFRVAADVGEDGAIKVRVDVSGARTQEIFDDVFSKLVNAAQPIPGFRRVKGGKTPDIPKDVLLQIIGPSKVNKETILKVINTTVADYVSKEGLNVTRDLRVEQSYDEIEAAFIPGKEFSFEAIIRVQENNKSRAS